MKRICRALGNREGFTLVELILTVGILAILVSIATVSYDALKAHVRYAKLVADMDGIAKAGYTDYTTHDQTWAPEELPGVAPTFSRTELGDWPQPPCPSWVYDWDNWTALAENVVRVTVRHNSDYSAIFAYCVDSQGSNCDAPDVFGGPPRNVTTLTDSHIYCNE